MPVRVAHIIDEAAPEDGVRLLNLLLRLAPPSQIQQQVVLIGRAPGTLAVPAGIPLRRLGRRFGSPLFSMLDLRRELRRLRPDVLHAIGAGAAATAGLLSETLAEVGGVATTLSDPREAAALSRWWRSLRRAAQRQNLICTAETVRRRAVESGIPMELSGVIRPGVDFGELRQAQTSVTREQIGLPERGRVLLTASPPSRHGGQYFAVWAMAMLTRIWPEARMIVPGTSREQCRLRRLMSQIDCGHIYVVPGNTFSPAELLSVSDVLVAPPLGDWPTGWLAWAMAAGVPIVATAVPAVTELIADRHNGFLCRAGEPLALAIRIRTALEESGDLLHKCTQEARDQAYEVFRAQRCVRDYVQAFTNLVAGERATAGIQDAALRT